jgi:hypothetical protein
VFAEWVVPQMLPWDPAPSEAITVGFWVGLDGFTNGQVLQPGIAATLTPDFWLVRDLASVRWWAWTEWYTTQYKDPAVEVTNFPLETGNTVSFLVCAPEPETAPAARSTIPSVSRTGRSRTSRVAAER